MRRLLLALLISLCLTTTAYAQGINLSHDEAQTLRCHALLAYVLAEGDQEARTLAMQRAMTVYLIVLQESRRLDCDELFYFRF